MCLTQSQPATLIVLRTSKLRWTLMMTSSRREWVTCRGTPAHNSQKMDARTAPPAAGMLIYAKVSPLLQGISFLPWNFTSGNNILLIDSERDSEWPLLFPRVHLEGGVEKWAGLMAVLEELWSWLKQKDEELIGQRPSGETAPGQQQDHGKVSVLVWADYSTRAMRRKGRCFVSGGEGMEEMNNHWCNEIILLQKGRCKQNAEVKWKWVLNASVIKR